MKRINRTTFIRLVEQAIKQQQKGRAPLSEAQLETLRDTADRTDHFLVGKWGDCQCGCLVGQSYNAEGEFERHPRSLALETFGLNIDSLVRDYTGISTATSEGKPVVKVVDR